MDKQADPAGRNDPADRLDGAANPLLFPSFRHELVIRATRSLDVLSCLGGPIHVIAAVHPVHVQAWLLGHGARDRKTTPGRASEHESPLALDTH